MKWETCVKCGEKIPPTKMIDFDHNPSCIRYICPSCAEEEGIAVDNPEES